MYLMSFNCNYTVVLFCMNNKGVMSTDGEVQKKKEESELRKIKVCSFGTQEILGNVFKTLPR